jgi:hypothetical protein
VIEATRGSTDYELLLERGSGWKRPETTKVMDAWSQNGPGSYKRRKRNDYEQDATPNSN